MEKIATEKWQIGKINSQVKSSPPTPPNKTSETPSDEDKSSTFDSNILEQTPAIKIELKFERKMKKWISRGAGSLAMGMLIAGFFIAALPMLVVGLTVAIVEPISSMLTMIKSWKRGSWKLVRVELEKLRESFYEQFLEHNIDIEQFKKYRHQKNAEFDSNNEYLKTLLELDLEITRLMNQHRKLKGKLAKKIHDAVISLLFMIISTLLFTPCAPFAIILLIAIAAYSILDKLELNFFKWLLKKILGQHNPFHALNEHASIAEIQLQLLQRMLMKQSMPQDKKIMIGQHRLAPVLASSSARILTDLKEVKNDQQFAQKAIPHKRCPKAHPVTTHCILCLFARNSQSNSDLSMEPAFVKKNTL